ncbi:hypothetical protein YTPLAS73_09850 [Nitrosarchaeum sp.]|nr:hypothetical protein YTPLAS73_09850 [Nitrosarchaeum sp.]
MFDMIKKEQTVNKYVLILSIALISFGSFNAANNVFAQSPTESPVKCVDANGNEVYCADPMNLLMLNILEQLLSTVGPIVAGAVTMGISFARKKGLQISAEAEEYFVNSAKSFVDNQSRYVFKQFMENPEYREQLANGKMPQKLGKEIFQNVKSQLLVEIKSDEFTKKARNMLAENIDSLIERTLSESKKELAQRARNLLVESVPLAVDSALLYVENQEIDDEQKKEIVQKAINMVAKHFDAEYIIMSTASAKMYIEAELKKRLK